VRNRELIFFNAVALVFGAIALITYAVCWPLAKAMHLRERLIAWREAR